MRKISLLMVWIILFVTACGGGDSKQELIHQSGKLISARQVAEYSNNSIQVSGVEIKYPVKVYRLVYETKGVDGEFLNASGLLTIPQKSAKEKSPILIYHHGTIYNNRHAPTENIRIDSSSVLPAFVGFIAVAPDYIGYGESLGHLHPYLNAKITASSSVDLLRAARQYLKNNDIGTNDQLFLGGYSQGGGATIATQRLIENELPDEFTVTASSAGAGSYNLSKELLDSTAEALQDYDNYIVTRPSNIGLIFKAMDDAYNLAILDKIFQSSYASVVESIYDGSHNSDFIDKQLSKDANKLIKKDFLERLVNGDEKALVDAFKDNDVFDWTPKVPTRLYHGRDDDWVNFYHAQTAYDTMIDNGATQLELVECVVADNQLTNHANCFDPYLLSSYEFFSQFANDL